MAVTGKNGYYEQHTAAADGAASTHTVLLSHIIWHGFTDAAHTLQVKDGAGNIVLPEVACGAAATVIGVIIIPFCKTLVGLETDVLGSGTVVYVYK